MNRDQTLEEIGGLGLLAVLRGESQEAAWTWWPRSS